MIKNKSLKARPQQSAKKSSGFKPAKALKSGFALIATISIMVLLVMVALAMLTLSTVELKSAANGTAMDEARANARLALIMAIGELQANTVLVALDRKCGEPTR